jgi:CheY-like chemotaxis protein
MDIRCPRCGNLAGPAGHEDARAFYRCENCDRVWMTFVAAEPAASARRVPAKVLVVDDSPDLLALVTAWLQDEGFIVFTATSGMQALDIAESHAPDVVLLDVIIPPPDGFAVCESLQRRERPPEIILMTGLEDPGRMRRVDELGGLVLLRKPLTNAIVVESVERAAKHRAAVIARAGKRS